MISISEIGGLYLSTPANIRDARTKAFMYACDKQIKKLLGHAEKLKVWCAVESIDEIYLDFVAAECRAVLYDSSLNADVKRDLIVNSQYWQRNLGTSTVLEEVINSVFPGTKTAVKEWFEYGGRPYFFKIQTNAEMDKTSQEEFHRMITSVKNARSCMDGIDVYRDIEQKLYSYGVSIIESRTVIGWEG